MPAAGSIDHCRATLGIVTSFATLAGDLKSVWNAPTTDSRLKKRIVRMLIEEVIADIDAEAGEIILLAHWAGGVHTELRLPRRRRGQRNSTPQGIVAAVRLLARIASDDLIAGILNRNKLKTGHGNRWTRERVAALRSHHKIPVHRPPQEGNVQWFNLAKAAAHLQVSAKTLRLAAERGDISGIHPLPDGPWLFDREMGVMKRDYNEVRPHSAIGNQTPIARAFASAQTCLT